MHECVLTNAREEVTRVEGPVADGQIDTKHRRSEHRCFADVGTYLQPNLPVLQKIKLNQATKTFVCYLNIGINSLVKKSYLGHNFGCPKIMILVPFDAEQYLMIFDKN